MKHGGNQLVFGRVSRPTTHNRPLAAWINRWVGQWFRGLITTQLKRTVAPVHRVFRVVLLKVKEDDFLAAALILALRVNVLEVDAVVGLGTVRAWVSKRTSYQERQAVWLAALTPTTVVARVGDWVSLSFTSMPDG